MMQIEIDRTPANYRIGEEITGVAIWEDIEDPESHFEVRLIWYTEGKGTRDIELISVVQIDRIGQPSGKHPFRFVAPHRPYSFNGEKLSLTWALELIEFPGMDSLARDICISPTAEPVLLEGNYDDRKKRNSFFGLGSR